MTSGGGDDVKKIINKKPGLVTNVRKSLTYNHPPPSHEYSYTLDSPEIVDYTYLRIRERLRI